MLPHLNKVFLTGFMGAGKSSVGRLVASQLEWTYCDTDERIVARTGIAVADFFERYGEPAFRELERQAVQELASGAENAVVSLGGGALLNADARQVLFRSGLVVYLSAKAETLAERLKNENTRPLLKGREEPARLKRIKELLALREPVYQLAAVEVVTDNKSLEEVAAEVIRSFKSWKRSG